MCNFKQENISNTGTQATVVLHLFTGSLMFITCLCCTYQTWLLPKREKCLRAWLCNSFLITRQVRKACAASVTSSHWLFPVELSLVYNVLGLQRKKAASEAERQSARSEGLCETHLHGNNMSSVTQSGFSLTSKCMSICKVQKLKKWGRNITS